MKNILVRLTMNNKENLKITLQREAIKPSPEWASIKDKLPRTRFLTSHNSLVMKVYSNRSSRTLRVS